MAEQALYRKYRSANFSEVIGQDHVVTTLTTAIASGRLSHAYLFTGPRGTGKTSVARLLARALNCTGGPRPCNTCANCLAAINASLDLIEMDAASNRSIDAIRDLREKIGVSPAQGKYKIYIIDEVHMLTTEAFNALLKTLEEPPAHAVFILATTEAHKLPETIISRTQRFNFKPITSADLVKQLQNIAQAENFNTEPAALEVIAAAARGGFRDAISMLDQLASSGISPITPDAVNALLGYSSVQEITTANQAIAARDTRQALTVLTRLSANGAQAGQVATQMIDQWRAVLLTAAGVTTPQPNITADLVPAVPAARAAAILEALLEVTRSHWPELALETAVAKLTAPAEPAPHPRRPTSPPTESTNSAAPKPPAATETVAPTAPAGTSLNSELWPKVLVHIKAQNNSLAALLQMYPVDFTSGEIVIKPRFNFHRDLFLKTANRTAIEAAAAKVYGRAIKIHARTEEIASKTARPKSDPTAELVSSALEILGGEVID